MARLSISAEKRQERGKGGARTLRAAGYVPGIVYGRHIEPVLIQMKAHDVFRLAHQARGGTLESTIVTLDIADGEKRSKRPALIKEIQTDPLHRAVLHIDFNEVSETEKIRAPVPVVTVGESKGQKGGGILQHVLREIEVSCFPADLPEEIRVDVSELDVHQTVRVGDLNLGPKVEILASKDQAVVTVVVPRAVEEVAEVKPEEAAQEPELIGKKAEEEDVEEEGAEGKKAKPEAKKEEKEKDKDKDKERK